MKNIYRCRVCGLYTEEPIHCGVKAELFLDGERRLLLSKLLSYILRHDPSSIGIELDEEGWTDIESLVNGIKYRWRNSHLYKWLRKEHVIAIAMLDPKGRFEVRENKIRARYGHNKNLHLKIRYEEEMNSGILYHGTSKNSLANILREGIKPMKRMYVHLSTSVEDACTVGSRHGVPVVLVIDVECLRRHGLKVYRASERVELVEYVPPQCIIDIRSC